LINQGVLLLGNVEMFRMENGSGTAARLGGFLVCLNNMWLFILDLKMVANV